MNVVGEFHLQSLALAMVSVNIATLLCLAPAIFRFPDEYRPSFRAWIAGTALVALTDVVFFTGVDFPFLGPILFALVAVGITEWIHALRRLDHRSGRSLWLYGLVILAAITSAILPAYPLGMVMTASCLSLLYLAATAVALKIPRSGPSVGRGILIGVFGVIGVVMAVRVFLLATQSSSGASPGFTSLPRAIMFTVAAMAPFAGSLGFVLTCGERLGYRLLHLSLTDALTGIPNRRAFLDVLQQSLISSRRHDRPVAVMIVDIDHFKDVNDQAGHTVGDQVLTQVTRMIANSVRREDTVGRLGGEEFGIIQNEMVLDEAAMVAERLRSKVATTPISVNGRTFSLTVSIGVVDASDCELVEAALDKADAAMYAAKRLGRNKVSTHG